VERGGEGAGWVRFAELGTDSVKVSTLRYHTETDSPTDERVLREELCSGNRRKTMRANHMARGNAHR